MSPLFDMPLAAVLDVVRVGVMVLFILIALFLTIVILMQEGKGGGLAGAFGGAGAETFGVKAGTVNRFTAWLAAGFLGLALLHAGLSAASMPKALPDEKKPDLEGYEDGDPATDPQPGGGQPAGGGGAPPGDPDAQPDDEPKEPPAEPPKPEDEREEPAEEPVKPDDEGGADGGEGSGD